ncbi:hypothetical protein NDU88_004581 [Pleurodeles waltl]|uniref:Uncharacterized protein n=1 Tax=Pleurodeles waltl TaxID=8319 RepID=A0AAV7V4V8_PLEWA|nr:hypothetical protein NDU88_004581 [Pleurodeles waltl]
MAMNNIKTEKEKTASEIEQLFQLLRDKENTMNERLEEMEKKITMVENAKLPNQVASPSDRVNEMEECEEPVWELLKNKMRAEKQKIASEIEQLHQLLRDEEQTLYGRLEEMEKTITLVENENISKLSNQITSLNALITDLEKKCEEPAWEVLKVRHSLTQ